MTHYTPSRFHEWIIEEIPFSDALKSVPHDVAELARKLLRGLCDEYPFRNDDGVASESRRMKAFSYLDEGLVTHAIWILDGTGIPQEELARVAGLIALANPTR